MTPQERELVTELFDRLATLESTPRDPDAERAMIEGLRRAPNAVYALVQTALVQDEALKRADARIRELESGLGEAARPTGFLDGMRDALLGRRETSRGGSVPSVRPAQMAPSAPAPSAPAPSAPASSAPWQQAPVATGGSFLGTAASAAAGVIGGALLLDGIRSMMGHGHGAFGMADPAFGASGERASPWDSGGGGDLARQAGIGDIGTAAQGGRGSSSGAGLFDNRSADDGADDQTDQEAEDFNDNSGDFGGDFGGGGDDA